MKPYFKISSMCNQCDSCRLICPKNCIIKNDNKYVIETWACNMCHLCAEICPQKCIKITNDSEQSHYSSFSTTPLK